MSEKNLPSVINYDDPKTIAVLKNTVAKGATDAEYEMFVGFCKATRLNPFKKEIWFIKTAQGVQMMTGINGYYAIANDHPQYDGLETETTENDGKIEKAVCKCYRKDRSRPMTATAYFSEFGKSFGNWKTMPRYMLEKCAEAIALRKSFPQELGGTYIQEEMPEQFEPRVSIVEKPQPVEVFEIKDPATWRIEGSQIGKQSGKVKSIGKLVGEIERETLLKAIRDKRAQVMLSENDINAIIGYLAATEPKPEMEVVPIEEDEIPTTWSDPE